MIELVRCQISRAALSNMPGAELCDILASHELFLSLDLIRGSGDWSKAESLVRLLWEGRFEPERCLFFGDGKGDLAAARQAGVEFVAIDPGTGEFAAEEGFKGPSRDLAEWGEKVLGMKRPS